MNISRKRKNKILIFSFIVAFFMILSSFAAMSTIAKNPIDKTSNKDMNNFSNTLLSPLHKDFGGTGNNINPTSLYSSEPAPMGLTDYGIESSGIFGTAYAYNTASFLGGIAIDSLSVSNNTTNSQYMTFQFNINLVFYDGETEYVYWVQDVAFLNTTTHDILFIDNVWNMSSASQTMYASTLTGNGTVANSSGLTYYYDYAAFSLPGNNITLNYPSDIQLMMNSTTTNQGVPEVALMYNDGYGWQTYDNVYFSFVTNLTYNLGFVVSGYQYEPNGFTPYDAELILGGPGGGSSTTDMKSNVNLTIQYWNGNNYQEIPSAYNYGSDTAETIGNVVSGSYYTTNDGSLFEYVTAGAGSLGQVYSSADISILNISMPLNSGVLYVNGTAHNFVNGGINLTLGPGDYQIKIYSNSLLYREFDVNLTAGEYLSMETAKSLVTFTATGIPQGTVWWVNLTGHSYSSSTNTISFYESNGTYSYTIATDNKNYKPSSFIGQFTVYGDPVSESVIFSTVTYSVIFTESGLPSGSTWYVNITNSSGYLFEESSSSATIIFLLINGTYTFSNSTADKVFDLSSYSGTLTVNGMAVTLNAVTFSKITYTVTFTESGLPAGSTWHVNLTNGQSFSSSISTISFNETNGTYSYTIGKVSGFTVSQSSGSVTVNGGSVSKAISFTANPSVKKSSTPSSVSGMELYEMIGAVVAVIGIVLAVATVMRKR